MYAVRQDGEACGGRVVKIAVELVGLAGIEAGSGALGFDEDDDLAVALDGVIHLFAFFGAYVGRVFGNDDAWVKGIIAERLKERQDKRVFRRFFRGGCVFPQFLNACCQCLDSI